MDTVTLDRRDASRTARRLVAADCAGASTGPGCAEAAELLTSEVVTNAVVHGGDGDITFGVETDSRCCRVEVGDDEPRAPHVRGADAAAESGRGMMIVAALASEWGVTNRPDGKTVWFEVAAQP